MGRNQTSMKRGKLQSVVKQMRQVQTAAQKRRRLDKEREAAARNKEARNHKIAAERAKLPFASSQRILLIGEANFSFAHALADNFLQLHLKELAERLGEEATETGIASEKGIAGGDDEDEDEDDEDDDDKDDDEDDSEADEDVDADDHMASSSSASSSSSSSPASSSTSVALSPAAAAAAAAAAKAARSAAAADLPDIATRLATARFEYSFTCGARIVATSFDVADIIAQKYEDAKEIISKVQMRGVRVLHGIDGTKLHTSPDLMGMPRFDRIVFVFPHTGCGIKDRVRNIADQQRMLAGFFVSAVKLLTKEGEIHLTIKRGEPYDSWKVPGLARDCHVIRLDRAYEFFPHLYPGYSHRRTLGFSEHVSDADNADISGGATTYVFKARKDEAELARIAKLKKREAAKLKIKEKEEAD